MSIPLDVQGAAEAAPTQSEPVETESSRLYEAYVGIAHELSQAGLAKSQCAALISAFSDQRNLILTGDERSFVKASIAVPALSGHGLVAVLLPSLDALRRVKRLLSPFPLNVASFDLAPSKSEKREIWEAMDRGEIDVILVSPGRLTSKRFRERMARRPLAMLALAHAHLMSPWSHRFMPNYRQVGAFVRSIAHVPKSVHIWSADKQVHQDVQRTLGLTESFKTTLVSETGFTPSLTGVQVRNDQERISLMEEFILNHECQGVIYVGSVKQLHDTKRWLESLGEQPEISRPGMDEFSLQKVRQGFESGERRIVISQGAFLSTLERAPGIEFVIFNGMPDSLETIGQEIFSQESASPIACLCLSSEHDFYHHRFAIDKNYPDALTLRACFQGVKDAFGSISHVSPDTLKAHVKVATPFPEDEIALCLSVMQREGLIEHVFDAEIDQILIRLTAACDQEAGFWHEYPLRKLEQIARLERTRDFLATNGDLGKSLRDRLEAKA